ncbi:TrkA family potassium uptake protein [Chloroflexi bacterium TSY]|nr:TrkA family potassium uptake protein [Chloroflexi bacterium TSY]
MVEKQYLVIGVGRFGSALASTLYEQGHEVVAVDKDEEAIEDIMNMVTHAVIADATDEKVLEQLGCSSFDTVIVAIGDNLEANILATVAAKTIGAKEVISKAKDDMAARILTRVGADKVVRPEHDMGVRLAQQLSSPQVLETLGLGEQHSVLEVEAELVGTLQELQLPRRFGIQAIAVDRRGEITVGPAADFFLSTGDKLLLLGENIAIQKLRDYFSEIEK